MKKVLFLFIFVALATMLGSGAKAEITVKDYMSYDFLDTQGYSGDMLRLVEINKAKTFGERIPSVWPTNKVARGWAKMWAYLDPAQDYGDFGEHDIKIRTTMWDY